MSLARVIVFYRWLHGTLTSKFETNFLSKEGRTTLAKSILNTIMFYSMQFYKDSEENMWYAIDGMIYNYIFLRLSWSVYIDLVGWKKIVRPNFNLLVVLVFTWHIILIWQWLGCLFGIQFTWRARCGQKLFQQNTLMREYFLVLISDKDHWATWHWLLCMWHARIDIKYL